MSDLGTFLAANRRNWDERVPIHRRDRSGFYAIDRYLAGEKLLHAIENGELGAVAGKRLIHLQCHFGLDTLILARHGAIATGLDFSPAAIAEARLLAEATGLAAEFVCADVYAAREAVAGHFAIAYVTLGHDLLASGPGGVGEDRRGAARTRRVSLFRRRTPEHAGARGARRAAGA
jgi:hypothetical protein